MPKKIVVPRQTLWDDIKEEFVYRGKDTVLVLEHSLVSLSKWEAKWHKPFLEKNEKSTEETLDYIKCMTLTQNVDPEVYDRIDKKLIREIVEYIEDPMTATWFKEDDEEKKAEKRIITAEVIYYQMIALNIPVEFQKWHLNRLLTLIRVCNEENKPKKKKSRRQILEEQHAMNRKRRAAQKAKKKGK